MIAPILPEAENLPRMLAGKVEHIIIDRVNGRDADKIYNTHGWNEMNTDEYFALIKSRIAGNCSELGIDRRLAY